MWKINCKICKKITQISLNFRNIIDNDFKTVYNEEKRLI